MPWPFLPRQTALLREGRSAKLYAHILLNSSEKLRRDYQELTASLDPVNAELEKLNTCGLLFVQRCSVPLAIRLKKEV
jgi:hypothetical protein